MSSNDCQKSRRDFLKKAAYTAPVILTIAAKPAFATDGSHNCVRKESGSYSTFDSYKYWR